jgi:hypothetical protein
MSKEEKLKIKLYEEQILKTKIFQGREKGELEMKGSQQSINQLNSYIEQTSLFSRNFIITDIVRFLGDEDDQKRFLHLYGSDGVGKCDIANYAGKYALYGRVYLEGAIYIDIEKKITINQII